MKRITLIFTLVIQFCAVLSQDSKYWISCNDNSFRKHIWSDEELIHILDSLNSTSYSDFQLIRFERPIKNEVYKETIYPFDSLKSKHYAIHIARVDYKRYKDIADGKRKIDEWEIWKEVQILNLNSLKVDKRFVFDGERTSIDDICITENENYIGFIVTTKNDNTSEYEIYIINTNDFSIHFQEIIETVKYAGVGLRQIKNALVWQIYDWTYGQNPNAKHTHLHIYNTNTFKRKFFKNSLNINFENNIIEIETNPNLTKMEEGKRYFVTGKIFKFNVDNWEIIK